MTESASTSAKSSSDAKAPDEARWTMMARCVQHRETRKELVHIERALRSGELDREGYELEHLRLAARIELRDQPMLKPFPNDAYAFAIAKHDGVHGAGTTSKSQFYRWYEQVEDRFRSLIATTEGLRYTDDERDRALLRDVVARGNGMHAHYAPKKAVGEIPWLPQYQQRWMLVGTTRQPMNVFEVWERHVRSLGFDSKTAKPAAAEQMTL